MSTISEDIIHAMLSGEPLMAEEEQQFEEWYSQEENKASFYRLQRLKNAVSANRKRNADTAAAWDKISPQLHSHRRINKWLKYAAVILLPLCAGISFYFLSSRQPAPLVISEKISPGTKQAVLTLSDGREVPLGTAAHPETILEKGAVISKDEKELLKYNASESTSQQAFNTIQVPKGGEYKFRLADGTMVWLNSDSRITYPVSFRGTSREVRLSGEAFFEVTKDKHHPFIVHTSRFDIRVTGTKFNVRSYAGENESATLEEGGIQWEDPNGTLKLKPGQQASLEDGEVKIRDVDTEEAISWRYGAFCFKQRKLENILNELGRWYDIEIFYVHPETRELHFTAWFSRSSAITEVLEILEKTQKVCFQLKGRTLTVTQNHETR